MYIAHNGVELNPSGSESFGHFIKDNGFKTVIIILIFVAISLLFTSLMTRSKKTIKKHKEEVSEDD